MHRRSLDPWFISGFIDAEGSFIIQVRKLPRNRTGWRVEARFKITLHKKDLAVLEKLQAYFNGAGKIVKSGKNTLSYEIRSLEEINYVVLPHFETYCLITQKKADFELFKQVVEKMKRGEHLTDLGIQEIVNIKASLNKGLSDELLEVFPNTVNFPRFHVVDSKIPNPHWLAGFTSGEGSFGIVINKSSTHKVGYVLLSFSLSQHIRDKQLMESLVSYLKCGRYVARNNKDLGEYICTKFSDIDEKIIPFFKKYPPPPIHFIALDMKWIGGRGVKGLDFSDWCKVADIIKTKNHLTKEGLDMIIKIKAGINTGRLR